MKRSLKRRENVVREEDRESSWRLRGGSQLGRRVRGLLRNEGATLVELAVAASIYFSLLFGIIETCFALYTFNFVADAAREGSRYAIVRGANSCNVSSTFPNCNLLPTDITSSTNNPILTYIESVRYPGLNASNLSAAVTWWVASQNANGQTSWTTACTGVKDANGNPCNNVGNAVKVVVTYRFPWSIPWLPNGTLSVNSTSEMMISE
ncbi:MAG: TadE family protein [Terracidiphilus sp.]